jgi:uncharacterized membrane protein
MIIPPETPDQLVRSYLHAVEHALADVPEDRRRELLGDLSDHIAAERAALDSPSEAAVRAILDRLGEPATIAAEQRLLEDNPTTPPAAPAPAGPSRKHRLGLLGWTLIALGLTLLICLVAGLVGLAVGTDAPDSSGPVPIPTATPLQPTHR